MKFCPECGTMIEGMKFCQECGYRVEQPIQKQGTRSTDDLLVDNNHTSRGIDNEQIIYEFQSTMFGLEEKSQSIGGKVDISAPITKYCLTSERIIIEKQSSLSVLGSKGRDEIDLLDIDDIDIKKSLADRATGKGDIILHIGKKKVSLKNIKDPETAKDYIRGACGRRKKFIEAQSKVEYRTFI